MMRNLLAAAVLATLAEQASATPIVLDSPGARVFDFTAIGGGLLTVATTNGGLDPIGPAPAFYGPDTGVYEFDPFSTIAGPGVAGVFPMGGTQGFSWTSNTIGDTDALTGIVSWSELDDGGTIATAVGDLLVTSTSCPSCDAAFDGDFPVGSIAHVSLSMNTLCPITDLALMDGLCPTNVVETDFNDGQINPKRQITQTPEPGGSTVAYLALLGFLTLLLRKTPTATPTSGRKHDPR